MNANPPNRSIPSRSDERRSLSSVPRGPPPPTFLQPDSAALSSRSRPSFVTRLPAHQARSPSPNNGPCNESQFQSENDTDGENADDEISEPGSDILYGISCVADDYETLPTDDEAVPESQKLSRPGSQGGIDTQLCGIGAEFEITHVLARDVESSETDELQGSNSDAIAEYRLVKETPASMFQDSEEATRNNIDDGWISKDGQSVSPRSRAQSPASFQCGDHGDLETRLITSQRINPKTKDSFYPRETFQSVITRDSVTQELMRKFPQEDDATIALWADQICYGLSKERPVKKKYTCFRRIFAMLVLLDQIPEIFNFLVADINDSNLPLSKINRPNHAMIFDLCLRSDPDKAIEFSTHWGRKDARCFWEWQWAMLSPFFAKRKARKKVWHYKLQRHVVLPYIETEITSEVHTGGFAQVSRVCIHDKHHNFHNGESFSGCFALKKLKSESREDFDREVDMLKKFRDQDSHLISLLVTYEHNDSFFLLFDWAKCNLQEYWAGVHPNPDPSDRDTVFWVVGQCRGISGGILKLHQYRTFSFNSENRETKEIYGHHGDIKEANILWFPESPHNPRANTGILKLADFGVAGFSTQHTGSIGSNAHFMATPSYRAPESDLTRPRAPGRSFDIWTLGILYLQFVTWMLGGQELLEKFDEKRKSLEPGYPFETDIFFERVKTVGSSTSGGKRYKIKDAVVDFFKELHHEMLIVRPIDPNTKDRIKAGELHTRWNSMAETCSKDEAYALAPVPRNENWL
ncbi:hypothetical protein S40293_04995 [Stachybotrys chartarum IBT 40293]|nr:hypothetical protein S40293_04995 [Stachybotrys chartarum IBT 40293]